MTAQSTPTGETIIAIVPPPDIQGFANHYRQLYMPDTMHRIEPHITLVYPFVPYSDLEKAAPRLGEVLAQCEPVWVSLRGFEIFENVGVLYIRIGQPENVLRLYTEVLAEFPDYPAYGGEYGDNLVPHMTVGRFSSTEELEAAHAEVQHLRLYIGWEVTQVVVKYKGADGAWHDWATLPVGRETGESC